MKTGQRGSAPNPRREQQHQGMMTRAASRQYAVGGDVIPEAAEEQVVVRTPAREEVRITRLRGPENYHLWKRGITQYIAIREVQKQFSDDYEPDHSDSKEVSLCTTILNNLVSTMSEDLQATFWMHAEEGNPAKWFREVAAVMEPKTSIDKAKAKFDLQSLTWDGYEPLVSFYARFDLKVANARRLGYQENLDDRWITLVNAIIKELPEALLARWVSFIRFAETTHPVGMDEIWYTQRRESLLADERVIAQRMEYAEPIFYSDQAQTRPPKATRSKGKPKCWHCGKPGHYERDCRAKKKEEGNADSSSSITQLFQDLAFVAIDGVEGSGGAGFEFDPEGPWPDSVFMRPSEDIEEEALIALNLTPLDHQALINLERHNIVSDSGCTQHIFNSLDFFKGPLYPYRGKGISVGNGAAMNIEGQGEVQLAIPHKNGETVITIKNALYIPDMKANLFSAGLAEDSGWMRKCSRGREVWTHKDHPGTSMKAVRDPAKNHSLHYLIKARPLSHTQYFISGYDRLGHAHRCMGHLPVKALKRMYEKGILSDLDLRESDFDIPLECNTCLAAGMTAFSFKRYDKRSVEAAGEEEFKVVNPEDRARAYQEFAEVALLQRHQGIEIPDSPSSEDPPTRSLCADLFGPTQVTGINGERYGICLQSVKGGFGLTSAVARRDQAPEEILRLIKMIEDLSGVKTRFLTTDGAGEFKSHAWQAELERRGIIQLIPPAHTHQLNGKAERFVRLRKEDIARLIVDSKYAVAETTAPYPLARTWWPLALQKSMMLRMLTIDPRTCRNALELVTGKPGKVDIPLIIPDEVDMTFITRDGAESDVDTDITSLSPAMKVTNQKLKMGDIPFPKEPKSLAQALDDPDYNPHWRAAYESEYLKLLKQDCFRPVPRHTANNVLPCVTAFTIKRKNGNINKFKVRICAGGHRQKAGVDYTEVHSPSLGQESVRALLAYAARYKYKIDQLDIIGAYPHADIDGEVFMELPESVDGFPHNHNRRTTVMKILKALYGLKQAGRLFHQYLRGVLIKHGFSPLASDPCIFIHNKTDIIIGVYVDDMLMLWKISAENEQIKKLLEEELALEDIGLISWFLGMKVECLPEGGYTLSQKNFIEALAKEFDLHNGKERATPLAPGTTLHAADPAELQDPGYREWAANTPFQSLAGALLWAARCTRPDIYLSVSLLCRHMTAYGKTHYKYLRRIGEYLYQTRDLKLEFHGNLPLRIETYADAAYADDPITRKSTSGHIVFWGGMPVEFKASKQRVIALSTTEAEYIEAAEACKSTRANHMLLMELESNLPEDTPDLGNTQVPTLYQDNQAAIHIMNNEVNSARSKHIDIRFHYIREQIRLGNIIARYISTDRQLADGFTKIQQVALFLSMRPSWMGGLAANSLAG